MKPLNEAWQTAAYVLLSTLVIWGGVTAIAVSQSDTPPEANLAELFYFSQAPFMLPICVALAALSGVIEYRSVYRVSRRKKP